jgi:hypothetical protein
MARGFLGDACDGAAEGVAESTPPPPRDAPPQVSVRKGPTQVRSLARHLLRAPAGSDGGSAAGSQQGDDDDDDDDDEQQAEQQEQQQQPGPRVEEERRHRWAQPGAAAHDEQAAESSHTFADEAQVCVRSRALVTWDTGDPQVGYRGPQ